MDPRSPRALVHACAQSAPITRAAARMHASGANVADIRAAIDRKYPDEYGTSTPTPPVPHFSAPH